MVPRRGRKASEAAYAVNRSGLLVLDGALDSAKITECDGYQGVFTSNLPS
jgi:hypothetical protein